MIRLRPSILFLCLAAAVLFFSRSLLHPGFFFAHDFTHASRIVEMRRALEAGAFPVAWTQNFGFGYGMPLFLFYGPLPFYVGVILTWLGWSTIGAIKMLILLSGALAAAGMATLFRHRGRSVALTAGLVLLAFPYRAVDIFVRGALSEALAIGLLPWILVGAQQLPWHPRRGMLMTSAAVAALLLTHNLTAFIGLPILAGLGVIWLLLFADFPWRRVGQYFLAGLLGVALSFFFTLPVIFENQATSVASITTGGVFRLPSALSLHSTIFLRTMGLRWLRIRTQ